MKKTILCLSAIIIGFVSASIISKQFNKKSFVDLASDEAIPLTADSLSVIDNTHLNNVGRGIYDLFSPKFRCNNFLNSLDRVKNINVAVLYNTFGNDFDCAKSILQDHRTRNFEVHLFNEACVRNHRCGKYGFLSGLSVKRLTNLLKQKSPSLKIKFDKYVLRLQDLLAGFLQPDTECQISFGLESNVKDVRAVKVALSWVREAFPQCKTVWNPLQIPDESIIKQANADYIEGHGNTPPISAPCIADNDGTEIKLDKIQDFVDSYAYCKIVALWTAADNCYGPDEHNFIDPRSRSCIPGEANISLAKEIVKSEKKPNPYQTPPSKIWTEAEKKSLKDCDVILGSTDGYKKGFLLKQSDVHPGIVILLPGTPQKKGNPNESKIKDLEIFYKGRKLFSLDKTGTFTEDQYGNRPLFRTPDSSNHTLASIPFHVVLREDGGKVCRKINNPKIRND